MIKLISERKTSYRQRKETLILGKGNIMCKRPTVGGTT